MPESNRYGSIDSVARVCASQGVPPSGPGNTYTEADFDRALDFAVIMRNGRLADRVLAAVEQAEDDEFAALFPPTGNRVEASAEDDEFSPLFPPPGTSWA